MGVGTPLDSTPPLGVHSVVALFSTFSTGFTVPSKSRDL